jgi:hypothetical protein
MKPNEVQYKIIIIFSVLFQICAQLNESASVVDSQQPQ